MNFYLVLPLVQTCLCLALIIVVLKGHISDITHRLFSLYLLGLACWGIVIYGMRSSPTIGQAYEWEKWIVILAPLISVFLYHFVSYFTGIRVSKIYFAAIYVLCIVFISLSRTGLIISGMEIKSYGYTAIGGMFFIPWAIFSYVLFILALRSLWKYSRSSLYVGERNRSNYIIVGLGLSLVGGTFDALPMLGLPLYPGAIIGNIIFCLLTTVAIIKYHLLEVHIIFRKGISYLLIGAIVGLVYVGAMYLAYSAYGGVLPLWAHVIALILLVLTLRLLWDRVQRIVDRWFYQDRYDFLNELDRFIQDTHDISDLEQLGSSLVGLIGRALQTSSVYLVLLSEYGDFRVVSSTGGVDTNLTLKSYSSLLHWLRSNRGVLYHHDIEIIPQLQSLSAREKKEFENMGVELFVPLKTKKNKFIGLLLLGKRLSGGLYSEEDMRLVLHVPDRVAIELENARLYFIETIMRSELQSQDERKTEFLHNVAHELKTPLTSLISSSELLETEMDNISREQRKRIVNNIYRSVWSMNRRVTELLDFARSQIGTLKLKLEPARIESVVSDTVDRLGPVFENKGKFLKLKIPGLMPEVNADIDKLEQVLVNLLTNANKYSTNYSEIIVRVRESDSNVIVEVSDSAPPVESEEREKIFEPYFRGTVGNDNGQIPGLGLGLAIAKQIIDLHLGKIWVDSQPDKGNTFAFSLPALY